MRQTVVPTQVHDVPALESAGRTLERLFGRDLLHDVVPEVTEQVDALVPDLVDTLGELLTAQLARGLLTLHINGVIDGQGGQVRDVFELRLERLLPSIYPRLLLVLHLDHVQISGRGQEVRQFDLHVIKDKFLQVVMTPDVVPEPGLSIGVGQAACRTLFRALLQPVPELMAQVEVHKVPAQIQTRKVAVVTGSALGKLLILGVGFVGRDVPVLPRGALALGTGHVDVQLTRVQGHQFLNHLGMSHPVVQDQRDLLLRQVRALGTLERWLGGQLTVQHLGEVQNDMFHLLALVLELGVAVLARDGGKGDRFDGHGLTPSLLHLLQEDRGLDAELVGVVLEDYFVADAIVDA